MESHGRSTMFGTALFSCRAEEWNHGVWSFLFTLFLPVLDQLSELCITHIIYTTNLTSLWILGDDMSGRRDSLCRVLEQAS